MSITAALAIWSRPAERSRIEERRKEWTGPFRAMSAYKGDEDKGARDWPWIVVGAASVNCFGALWPKEYAIAVANIMNETEGR
jgi:hypothetical protein